MGTAFLYGNGGGGGTGATLTITAPAGCTVTVSKDGRSKTKVAGVDGVAVFKGLETGEWTITITDGEHTAQKTVTITADYSAEITFFVATINVTYPAGSTCTATDGVTTITAPDTSGTWVCGVPNTGTWTLKIENGASNTVTVSNGGRYTVNKWYFYKNGTKFVPFEVEKSASFESSNIKFDAATAGDACAVTSTNKISIKNCSNLVFIINVTKKVGNNPGARFGLVNSKTINDDTTVAYRATNSTGSQTITVSISSISGSYYVFASSWLINLTISEIYLEV